MLKRISMVAACFAMLFLATGAKANEWDMRTTITFSQAVELPGIVLPAGTYVFKLANIPGRPDVVQVFNADENRLMTTIIGLPDLRTKATAKPYIGLEERPAGTPTAILEWFYPGDVTGVAFGCR